MLKLRSYLAFFTKANTSDIIMNTSITNIHSSVISKLTGISTMNDSDSKNNNHKSSRKNIINNRNSKQHQQQ